LIEIIDEPKVLLGHEDSLREWLLDCATRYGYRVKSLSYRFLNDLDIRAANKTFLNHDYATDIITFNYTEKRRLEVEMLLGYETITKQASEHKTAVVSEFCRVMVHGLLHCCGYNDVTDEERRMIRKQEEICLDLRPKKLIIS